MLFATATQRFMIRKSTKHLSNDLRARDLIGRMTTVNKLLKYASFGGLATVGGILGLQKYVAMKLTELEYYKTSLAMLRNHKEAVKLLGEPVRERNIDVGDSKSTTTRPYRARMKVPLSGSKQSGDLYLWAQRRTLQDSWEVLRLELGLQTLKDKRLLVYANPGYGVDYVRNFDVDAVPDLVDGVES
ncbi:hypothetical protein ISCGN_019977 [Ixodes scapularis]